MTSTLITFRLERNTNNKFNDCNSGALRAIYAATLPEISCPFIKLEAVLVVEIAESDNKEHNLGA
ncbi:hypothetical protein [Sphingobacterium corticis]|uniref:hypothetical protein n=1 Tax=Sphingobacterium corticis TaxID=1812823 RepID=UPI0036D2DC45